MKYIQIAFSVANLFMKLLMLPEGKEILDGLLDLVEDAFPDDDGVQKVCKKIRILLNVPDND